MPPPAASPAAFWKAVDGSSCSTLAVAPCPSPFPFRYPAPGVPPLLYRTAQRKLFPPRAHSSPYGLYAVKKTNPVTVASGSVITRSERKSRAAVLSWGEVPGGAGGRDH